LNVATAPLFSPCLSVVRWTFLELDAMTPGGSDRQVI